MNSTSMIISWFDTGKPKGPALGQMDLTTWSEFTSICTWMRRESCDKDGPNFVPSRFKLEPDGRHVRRLKANAEARTAIALDIETSKKTGEIPPSLDEALGRAHALGWATLGYTSHSHTVTDERYRIVHPLSAEIGVDLPAPEAVARKLGLDGVLDTSKVGAASLFYLPSCPYGAKDAHQATAIDGDAIDAQWITAAATEIKLAREAEVDRLAAEAAQEAEKRRAERIAAGDDPDDSIIEKIRDRLDLQTILTTHSYAREGRKYRHPASQSGSFGGSVKTFNGIDRIFSHNAGDPLHADNLPVWVGGVTALDAFDVTAILDYGGDRNRAITELAKRFDLDNVRGKKAVAAVIYRAIRDGAAQQEIELVARLTGVAHGLSQSDINAVAAHVLSKITGSREAA
jgi:hypothetical protein